MWIIFTVALLLRLGFVLASVHIAPQFPYTDDSPRYDRLALNLVHRFQFNAQRFELSELRVSPDLEERVLPKGYLTGTNLFDGPEVKRVPGFPLALGLVYWVTGYHPYWCFAAQIILGSLTAVILSAIGSQLGGRTVGTYAGLLQACNPLSILHTAQVMNEVFSVFLITASLYLILRYIVNPTWPMTVAVALAMAVATLSRESGVFLCLVMLPTILHPLLRPERRSWRRGLPRAALIFLTSVGVIAAWMYRNERHYGHFFWTAHTKFSSAWYFGPKVLAVAWRVSEPEARLRILTELAAAHPEYQPDIDQLRADQTYYWKFNHLVEFNIRAESIVKRHFLENPGTTAWAFLYGGLWSLWGGLGEWSTLLLQDGQYRGPLGISVGAEAIKRAIADREFGLALKTARLVLSQLPPLATVVFGFVTLYSVIMYLLAVAGLGAAWRLDRLFAIQLVALIAFQMMLAGPAGNKRLFAVAYPLVALLAAWGAVRLRKERGHPTGGSGSQPRPTTCAL